MTLCDYCRKANRCCEVYPIETLTCVEYQVDPERAEEAVLKLAETTSALVHLDKAKSQTAFAALIRTLSMSSTLEF
jgi:hypothetical protein